MLELFDRSRQDRFRVDLGKTGDIYQREENIAEFHGRLFPLIGPLSILELGPFLFDFFNDPGNILPVEPFAGNTFGNPVSPHQRR